jgi:hypothetical protein
MHTKTLALTLFVAATVAGCAGGGSLEYPKRQGLTEISPNVFQLFREQHGLVLGSDPSLQRQVVEEANAFAEKRGMIAVPIEARVHPAGNMGDWGWCYYKFQLSPKGDMRVSKSASEISFEKDPRMTDNFFRSLDAAAKPGGLPGTNSPAAKQNVYDELIKLDELRKKGILTEEEFQAQKKRVLE